MVLKVAIIGAGVNGLSCAIVIQEKFPAADLTIFADKYSPETTSDGAAGLWLPFSLGDTPTPEIYEYSKLTWKYLEKLWKSPLAGKFGVSLVPCIQTSNRTLSAPALSDIVYGFETLDTKELSSFDNPAWKTGFRFSTFTVETSKLLPYYLNKFKSNNGTVVARKLTNLGEIASYFQVIINCSGLGAYHLENGQLVHPICGHVIRVKAPWIKTVLLDESDHGCYIIPSQDTIVLGGTHNKDQRDISPRSNDTKFIPDDCIAMCPSLQNAEIVGDMVGLRPGRHCLRVEREDVTINNKKISILHNYGHGGSGLTLFYGCALRVADLLETVAAERLVSKL